MKQSRTFLDSIHKEITLDLSNPSEKLLCELIDSPEFQRLRRINQLGVANLTFQGAEGSRFTHSIGVMNIARNLIRILLKSNQKLNEYIPLVLCSALLHDLGHGPFSHVTEKILHLEHEKWSCEIISGDTKVNKILNKFSNTLADDIVKVLNKNFLPNYLTHFVSSQLDCDRFDYLLRDAYMTGTTYGIFALDRILHSLEIDYELDKMVVNADKGLVPVEDYLFARYAMYTQVYYHKKNLAAKALLASILIRAKNLLLEEKLAFCDSATANWLNNEISDVKQYLELDDVQLLYHIKKWCHDDDLILSNLSKRLLHRNLFKVISIDDKNFDDNKLTKLKNKALSIGFEPQYYLKIEKTGFKPYDYYHPAENHCQSNIYVKRSCGEILELSKISRTIESMTKIDYEKKYLIYPDELESEVHNVLGANI